jgi:flagellar protein FliL
MSEQTANKNTRSVKNILLIVIILLLIIAIVGGGAFAGYYFATKNNPVSASTVKAENIEEATIDIEELIVNLSDENTRRFLKVKLVLAYDSKNKKFAKELESKKPVVKDGILSVIRSKKAADLTTKGAEDLKAEILNRVNPVFNTGKLTNIYYSDFLVQ